MVGVTNQVNDQLNEQMQNFYILSQLAKLLFAFKLYQFFYFSHSMSALTLLVGRETGKPGRVYI